MSARDYFVHESSYVDADCEIGGGTKIWHFCHVMEGARIGRNCNIGQNVVVSPGVVVGDGVRIQNNVSLYTGVVLEDDVFCGPAMVFTDVVNPCSHIPRKHEYRATVVRRGATLGANCTIVCGHTIGHYAFIGAGAVVTRDVPDFALVVGTPDASSGGYAGAAPGCTAEPSPRAKRPASAEIATASATTGDSCATKTRRRSPAEVSVGR